MEPASSLMFAWSLFGDICLGVGINELHRQMVERFDKADVYSLSLQKALHSSLLDAVQSLAASLSDEKHPYFRSIDPSIRHDEKKRVEKLFQEIYAQFPKTGSLYHPIDVLLRGAPQKGSGQLVKELGLEDYLEQLPDELCRSFRANLSLVMLAHFRRKVATNSELGTLLQVDLITVVHKELLAVSTFLEERFGSDLPEQIRPLLDDLTGDLKTYITQELADLRHEVKRLFQLPDNDIFCLLSNESDSRPIERYLDHKANNRLFLDPKQVRAFTEKIERNDALLIRGLPGTGKTLTGLALAESLRFQQKPYTIFYINLRYDIEENDLIEGVKRRLTQPTLFFFDDCQGKYDLTDNLLRRLKRIFRQSTNRGLLLFASRTTPTPFNAPRGDESDFEAELAESEAILEFQPTLQFFRQVITLNKPYFAGLSKGRLERIFEFTGRDLFLLDQLLDLLETPTDIDQLMPETLYAKTLRRYFGKSTVYRPNFLKLAALAQFDLAPPVALFESDLRQEDASAVNALVVLAGRPPCYYLLHSSAAEIIFRALLWNNRQGENATAEIINHLLTYFQNDKLNDWQRTAALLNILNTHLRIPQSEDEELVAKGQFLADDNVVYFIERTFANLPLNTIARCLHILRSQNNTAFTCYYSILSQHIQEGLVLKQTLQQPFEQIGYFLWQLKANYPNLLSSLRQQINYDSLQSFVTKIDLRNYLLLLSKLAESNDHWWQNVLAILDNETLDRLTDQTIANGRSIGTLHLALRELGKTDPGLLRMLEAKISPKYWWRLLLALGKIRVLTNILLYMSSQFSQGRFREHRVEEGRVI